MKKGYRRPYKKLGGDTYCLICKKKLYRKILKSGREESYSGFSKRKTCGKEWDEKLDKYVFTECFKKFLTGRGNPNYKGYMPKCKVCGKKISYRNAEDMKIGKVRQFCIVHRDLSYKDGELHKAIKTRNKQLGLKRRGKLPERLRPYLFKKGRVSENKIYFDNVFCRINGCNQKPIGRFLCKHHYNQSRYKNL